MDPLAVPLAKVVGDRTARALRAGLGLHTVGDLLRHYPRRYYERGELADLSELRVGERVTIQAEVVSVASRHVTARENRKPLHKVDVVVTDGRVRLPVTFFNTPWLAGRLQQGMRVLFAGEVQQFRGRRRLTNPEVQVGEDPRRFAGKLIPIYPATATMASWKIANSVALALTTLDELPDPLPEQLRRRYGLVDLRDAFALVHQPSTPAEWRRGRERLRWDEAFVLQLVLAQRRVTARALPATPRRPRPGGLLDAFDARLPFALTDGQRAVGQTLFADLADDHAMQRLLHGEVGSGKTVCALRAMLAVVDAGGQAALLAPTEVLAQQHHRTITTMLGPLAERGLLGGSTAGTRVALLTGSTAAATRRQVLLDIASGDAGIVVGTHALLEDDVTFQDLGLVVVDEQHRFGVEQRDALRTKSLATPHLLVMTATPIPRTVAMTVFGDLEVSTLTELPGGRPAIQTNVVPAGERPSWLERVWRRVREEVAAGHQVYVVCPRIGADADDDERGDADETDADETDADETDADRGEGRSRRPPVALLDVAPLLAAGPLAGLRIDVLHGRLPTADKDDVMRRFGAGEVDVLVATTVIEVGVDVPNATVMVVMDADRFGVSQLHQLRGRVGRGPVPGLCLLVTDAEAGSAARERLDAVAATLDGFALSRVDLEQRREGDVLGAAQSGRRSSLRLLSVLRDEGVIVAARDEATRLVEADPDLAGHPLLRAVVTAAASDERARYLEKG